MRGGGGCLYRSRSLRAQSESSTHGVGELLAGLVFDLRLPAEENGTRNPQRKNRRTFIVGEGRISDVDRPNSGKNIDVDVWNRIVQILERILGRRRGSNPTTLTCCAIEDGTGMVYRFRHLAQFCSSEAQNCAKCRKRSRRGHHHHDVAIAFDIYDKRRDPQEFARDTAQHYWIRLNYTKKIHDRIPTTTILQSCQEL